MTWCGTLRQASTESRPYGLRIEELCRPLAGAGTYGKEMDSGGAC